MPAPIFISYSRHDGEFALSLGRDLRTHGADLWIDQLDIPPGRRWDREVERALRSCQTVIVVLSEDAVASEHVMDEVGYALGESKRVVPVLCRPCELPLRLQRVQYVDLSSDYRSGLQRLLATLAAGTPDDRVPDVPHALHGASRRTLMRPTRSGRGVAAVALAAVAGAAGALWMSSRAGTQPGAAPIAPAAAPSTLPATASARADEPVPLRGPVADTGTPAAMTRRLTEADLVGRSAWELDVMRNEIFARHGRRFSRSDLQAYFDAAPWYHPRYAPDEFPMSLLSALQKQNVEIIQQYQQRRAR